MIGGRFRGRFQENRRRLESGPAARKAAGALSGRRFSARFPLSGPAAGAPFFKMEQF
jgi:hypothetical protein